MDMNLEQAVASLEATVPTAAATDINISSDVDDTDGAENCEEPYDPRFRQRAVDGGIVGVNSVAFQSITLATDDDSDGNILMSIKPSNISTNGSPSSKLKKPPTN
jgi:hypothetical protein